MCQPLQKKSNEADPAGTIRETDPVPLTTKEVGLTVQRATNKNGG
jgi:hypothetical protein